MRLASLVLVFGASFLSPHQTRIGARSAKFLTILVMVWGFIFTNDVFAIAKIGELSEKFNNPNQNQLVNKYNQEKIKILIVPGHDDEFWGTEFKGVKEADLNLQLGKLLAGFFSSEGGSASGGKNDNHFETTLARDENGYISELKNVFNDSLVIKSFISEQKKSTFEAIQIGDYIKKKPVIEHVKVNDTIAQRLYGINKWANDNNVDIVLHIHFNDYPGRRFNRAGRYSGFSIYMPDKQFPNFENSFAMGSHLLKYLDSYLDKSDFLKEKSGLIEDQDLIAVGAHRSLNSVSLLIEYGYIYESYFQNENLKLPLFKELAYQTYRGLKDFFDPIAAKNLAKSTLLPYLWNKNLNFGLKGSLDVMALQSAFVASGINKCPITGNFLSCTRSAVLEFQRENGISLITGVVGPETREALNEKFGYLPPHQTSSACQ